MSLPLSALAPADGWPALSAVEAVVFDFDGTLVDTLPLHCQSYIETFAEIGLTVEPDVFYSNLGGAGRETIPKLLAGRPCPLSVTELHARKKEKINVKFRTDPIRLLGTARLLELFAGRRRLALCSAGARAGIEILLGRLGWDRLFETVVTG